MPRITVYMPAYEAKKEHIVEAIESVLAQTETEWELLIRDDCSQTEDVRAHVDPYLSDPRITYRRNEKNLGIGPNWNACLDFGTAPLIQYVFHDDVLYPDNLKTMADIMDANPSVGFASAKHLYRAEGEVRTLPEYEKLQKYRDDNVEPGLHKGMDILLWWLDQGLHPNIVGEPSYVMLRRNLIDRVGPFHETMPQFLDCEYWIRCMLESDWYNYTDADLGEFRVHPSAASAQNEWGGRGLYDRFDCFRMLIPKLPREHQAQGRAAFRAAFDEMVRKFFSRVSGGKKISTKGSGGLKKFCLSHPIFVGSAMARHLMRKK